MVSTHRYAKLKKIAATVKDLLFRSNLVHHFYKAKIKEMKDKQGKAYWSIPLSSKMSIDAFGDSPDHLREVAAVFSNRDWFVAIDLICSTLKQYDASECRNELRQVALDAQQDETGYAEKVFGKVKLSVKYLEKLRIVSIKNQ